MLKNPKSTENMFDLFNAHFYNELIRPAITVSPGRRARLLWLVQRILNMERGGREIPRD